MRPITSEGKSPHQLRSRKNFYLGRTLLGCQHFYTVLRPPAAGDCLTVKRPRILIWVPNRGTFILNPRQGFLLKTPPLLHSTIVGTGIDIWQLIKQKFPDQNDRVIELYESSEDFRSLLSDYASCIEHLQKFAREAGEKKNVIEEYLSIRNDLEFELAQFLRNSHSSRH